MKKLVALSINKVQTFLFDTIHAHVQEKQTENATLKHIQSASRMVSENFFSDIEEAFETYKGETLLSCSGVYMFYCDLEQAKIMDRLNDLFLEYYKKSQGKQQLCYVCFPAENVDKLKAIKEAKKRLMDSHNLASILEKNQETLFSFREVEEKKPLKMNGEYPYFAKDINSLFLENETDNNNKNHFRLAVIKADLDGMGDMFQAIDDYDTYQNISEVLNCYITLDGLHDIAKQFDNQRGWVFPFYIAGDDIFFAVAVADVIMGIDICRKILSNVNRELDARNIGHALSMSIGVEIVFNREPVRYYLRMVEQQLKCAKNVGAAEDKVLQQFLQTRIAIGGNVWLDLDMEKIKEHKNGFCKKPSPRCSCQTCKKKRKINRAIGRVSVWKFFLDEVEILAGVRSDVGEVKELIGTPNYFYSLLESVAHHEADDVGYMSNLLYHLRPRYLEHPNKRIRESELCINRGILYQLYKKTNVGSQICLDKSSKDKVKSYLRLMLVFSDEKRFKISGIKGNTRGFSKEHRETIRKELISKPRDYIYGELRKLNAELADCFVEMKSGKSGYVKRIRLEKSMFFRLRKMENTEQNIDQIVNMIGMKNPEDQECINKKNDERIAAKRKPCYKCFDKEKFRRVLKKGDNWSEKFVDALMLFYMYHDSLLTFKRLYKEEGGSKNGR